ncbi:MAG: PfaB family protein [Colwellia sp.]
MVIGNNNYAIIGLDAQFENYNGVHTDIDRVERALYLGKIAGKEQSKELAADHQLKLSAASCQQALARMAQANQLNSANIKVIIVSEKDNLAVNGAIEKLIDNAAVVPSLAQALTQLELLTKHQTRQERQQDNLVAILGLNLANNLADQLTETMVKQHKATISFDQSFTDYQHCHGIAALLFSSLEFAKTNDHYIYAELTSAAMGEDILATSQAALNNAKVAAQDIGLLEVSALANKQAAFTESQALLNTYSVNSHMTLNTAISCARSTTGEGAGFSQVLGLLRTVIALQQRYIPAISDWQQPNASELDLWQSSSFYLATESRPWYPQPTGNANLAAYSCLAANSDYCHVILQENKADLIDDKHAGSDIRLNGYIACSDLQLVLISGNAQQDLLTQLADIEVALEHNEMSIKDLAFRCFQQFNSTSNKYSIALLAESIDDLLKEILSAKFGVAIAFTNQKDWRTPKGSYFTPTPVNNVDNHDTDSNNVAFLYPGIGATYVGLGRDLFHLFPEIHQDVANLADDIGASLKDTLLNPRSIIRPDFNALKQLDLNLRGNLADIAEAGVGFACVFTKVFENVFKVKADYATGYSMGEVSMYAALGAWQQPGLMSARLANSDTFNERLCGDLLTLREHWRLPELNKGKKELIWETYTIKATLEQVLTASAGEERVYCTIINTPESLLLAGYPEDCLRVIKKLGVRTMALNMANAIHSAPANIEYDAMVDLYTMDVTPRITTKMYSSSCYLPIPQLSKAIANSVAKCLCDRVDFPRLINTLYDKGARVFIEMGPGRSLCSWVDKILDFSGVGVNQPSAKASVAVPVNAKGTSDELTYLRAIAKLSSHGVPLDLQRLFNGSIIVDKV